MSVWGRCGPHLFLDLRRAIVIAYKRFHVPDVCFEPSCPQPLSIMMTTASTLMAIATTPLLTTLLVGWVALWVRNGRPCSFCAVFERTCVMSTCHH